MQLQTELNHRDVFASAVITGLSAQQKHIPSRFLYDAAGSDLFEAITTLPEYYPTRTETALLRAYAANIVSNLGPRASLIEFGSGSATKTEALLAARPDLGAYVAIDISRAALAGAEARLKKRFPALPIHSIHGDFTESWRLPEALGHGARMGFFPGSTIGNFLRHEAISFLARAGKPLGPGSQFLIGVDLVKSVDILVPAYADAAGVTAQFNLNLLTRINRELDGTFALDGFAHEARWNAELSRIEMHLVSQRDQTARAAGRAFRFANRETIHTENSHKYTVSGFQALARTAGWVPISAITDAANLFSLHLLEWPATGSA